MTRHGRGKPSFQLARWRRKRTAVSGLDDEPCLNIAGRLIILSERSCISRWRLVHGLVKEIFLKIDRELSLIIDLFPVNCELLYQRKLRCSTSLLLFFSPSFFKILKVIGIILFLKQRISIVIFYCCLPLIKFLVPEIKATIMQNLDVYTEFTKFTMQKDKILIYLSYIFFNFRLILDGKICSQ